MKINQKKYNILTRIGRAFKLNYVKLLRSSGGAKKVSLGFAIGFALEMLVISTASLIYILFIPAVRLAKGSLPASVIGNVIGKLTFLPIILLPFARKIGKLILPMKVRVGHHTPFSFQSLMHGDFRSLLTLLHGGVHVLIGMTFFGIVLGIASYFVVHYLYETEKNRRLTKRRTKHSLQKNVPNKNFV
ncbi:DUF2062 domain-containing protein [Neobacillus bataviensis]|uniref:DUF2062 domain-containing protein n=1 Tax=Neobacillus bataviensis TaxID=220685 RepID=UPI001CBF2F5A|nr:DUF2062 domain-containing protein [Neobacillus bataviensis]